MDKTHVPYPGCYCADCVEGMPHERHNDLRGYIVGNGDRTKWRAWINGMPDWVDDPADATRYGFRSDANAVHGEDEDAWCVVKYEDVATPSARITGDKDRSVQSRAHHLKQPTANLPWNATASARSCAG